MPSFLPPEYKYLSYWLETSPFFLLHPSAAETSCSCIPSPHYTNLFFENSILPSRSVLFAPVDVFRDEDYPLPLVIALIGKGRNNRPRRPPVLPFPPSPSVAPSLVPIFGAFRLGPRALGPPPVCLFLSPTSQVAAREARFSRRQSLLLRALPGLGSCSSYALSHFSPVADPPPSPRNHAVSDWVFYARL